MQVEGFLPSKDWEKSDRTLIVATAGASAALLFMPFIGPIVYTPIIYALLFKTIQTIIKSEKEKQKKAILEQFKGKYTNDQLEELSRTNNKEFKRLYKLASDEFFCKYIKEQEGHRQAQEIVLTLQKRINNMRSKVQDLQKRKKKDKEEIQELFSQIQMYDEIYSSWKKTSENA